MELVTFDPILLLSLNSAVVANITNETLNVLIVLTVMVNTYIWSENKRNTANTKILATSLQCINSDCFHCLGAVYVTWVSKTYLETPKLRPAAYMHFRKQANARYGPLPVDNSSSDDQQLHNDELHKIQSEWSHQEACDRWTRNTHDRGEMRRKWSW